MNNSNYIFLVHKTVDAKIPNQVCQKGLLQLSVFDRPLMLWVNWTIVEVIHPQSNKFVIL